MCPFHAFMFDRARKFPTATTVHDMFLFNAGEYTGNPVPHTREVWRGNEERYVIVLWLQSMCLSWDIVPEDHMVLICWKDHLCSFTHLVIFLQMFLVVSDSCSQNSNWWRHEKRQWVTAQWWAWLLLKTPVKTHLGLPWSYGHSHPSGLLKWVVQFSDAAFHAGGKHAKHSATSWTLHWTTTMWGLHLSFPYCILVAVQEKA